jgi:hypothetical protein
MSLQALQNGTTTKRSEIYPFESLKQIHGIIAKLGYGDNATDDRAKTARQSVEMLWRILRAELLKELDRDFPEFPDTPYEQVTTGARVRANIGKRMSSRS